MARRPEQRTTANDVTYQAGLGKFLRMCSVALLMEAVMAPMAIYNYVKIPAAGDLTYRNICVGVPGFWAVVIPLIVGGVLLFYRRQSITLTSKAFVYRRGSFTIMMPWSDVKLADVDERKWDPNFTVSAKNVSFVVVRALFFPDYEEILEAVERRLKARDRGDGELNL